MLCSFAFLSGAVLGSTNSAAGCPVLFVGFIATTTASDFSSPCIIGFGSSPSRCGPRTNGFPSPVVSREISQFPYKKLLRMPGSTTTPGRSDARTSAPSRVAFRCAQSVSARDQTTFAAQCLAYVLPCRRFADVLAHAHARLGADVVCYSFIVVDLHHLLLAGLPAHLCENSASAMILQ